MQEMWAQPLGQEDPLEKGRATHSSVLVWKIPRTKKPGGLQSIWGCKELDMTELSMLAVNINLNYPNHPLTLATASREVFKFLGVSSHLTMMSECLLFQYKLHILVSLT